MALHVTTQQLDYLVAVAGSKSLAEAATSVGVTPSALSQGLSELERRIGLPLFEREGRTRVLTDYGREVLDYAERIVGLTNDLDRWAEAAREGQTGRIRLGLIDIAAVHYLASALGLFRSGRPDTELTLTVAPSASLVELLRTAQLDLAVVVEPPAPVDGVSTAPLLVDDLAVYPPPGATVGPPPTWGPWVGFPAASHTRQLIADWLNALGADYRVDADSNQPEVLRRLVALGLGWAVLPVIQAETEPAPLKRAPSAPRLSRQLVIARRDRSVVGPATSALIELLASHSGQS